MKGHEKLWQKMVSEVVYILVLGHFYIWKDVEMQDIMQPKI